MGNCLLRRAKEEPFDPLIWNSFVETSSTSWQTAWSVDNKRIAQAWNKGYHFIHATGMGQMYPNNSLGWQLIVVHSDDSEEIYNLYNKTFVEADLRSNDKSAYCQYLSINGQLAGAYGKFEFSEG